MSPIEPRTDLDPRLYRTLFDAAGDAIIVTSAQGIAIECNQAALNLLGCTREQLLGSTPVDWSPAFQPDGRASAEKAAEIIGRVRTSGADCFEWLNRRLNGELIPVDVTVRAARIDEQDLMVVITRDIRSRKRNEDLLRQQRQFSEDIIDSLPGIFYLVNSDGGFCRVNHRFLEVTGYSLDEVETMHALDFFAGDDKDLILRRIQETFLNGNASAEADFCTKSGAKIPYFFTGRRTCIEGNTFLVGLGTDITERRALEEEIVRQARTDSLTGLANRRHFMMLAEAEMARALRYGKALSILMLDLDHFKAVNDRHGHHIGDALLCQVADTFRQTLREVDIVGRMGGEEFAMLLPESDLKQAVEAAERLRQAIGRSLIPIAGSDPVCVTASIGVATLTDPRHTIDQLLSMADVGLYAAKHGGRNCVRSSQSLAESHSRPE